jgi:DNA-binding NarL/FixJ family response regulator
MRALLVGSNRDRARLRSQLADASIEIVGEFPTIGAARAAEIDADTIMLAGEPEGRDEEPLAEPLTTREREVLALVAEGLSNKAIAEELGISDQTVKFHVASITGKLGAANRTEAVRRAVRQGLIVL